MAPPSVGLFWDFENIAIPSDVSVSKVVESFLNLAKSYGNPSLLQAYMDTDIGRGGKFNEIRGDLQRCGVNVVDCPHQNRKEVVDVKIITDMLVFGLSRTPSVVILVSNDQGFSYPAAILRRSATVVLVSTSFRRPDDGKGVEADKYHNFRSELLKLPPKVKRPKTGNYGYQAYPAASTSRAIASISQTNRFPTSPPRYEEVSSNPFTTTKRVLPSMPPATIPSSGKNAKGKRVAPPPPPRSSQPPEEITLSDDDEEVEEEMVALRSDGGSTTALGPSQSRSPSVLSNASSTTSAARPRFAPAFPSTSSSANHLAPPSVRSRSRSRSRSADLAAKKMTKSVPLFAPLDEEDEEEDDNDNKEEEEEEEEKYSLQPSWCAQSDKSRGVTEKGSASKQKKRGFPAEETGSKSESIKKKRKGDASRKQDDGTKRSKLERERSDEVELEASEISILVISDDDDE